MMICKTINLTDLKRKGPYEILNKMQYTSKSLADIFPSHAGSDDTVHL